MSFTKQLKANSPNFRLKDIDPGFKGKLRRSTAERIQLHHLNELQEYQDRLFAEGKQAVLVVIQGMDASGKDGIVKNVMSGLNPAGCQATAFKVPSDQELKHGYLWRAQTKTPEKGTVGIFIRSHYEDVLVVKVHPEILNSQHLLDKSVRDRGVWNKRYQDINDFERYLSNNGIKVVKIFLHISKAEQGRRFLDRLADKSKHWKFSKSDLAERKFWVKYQQAFEQMIKKTSTDCAPWYVVPADKKWFARAAVGGILMETLHQMNPKYPTISRSQERKIRKIQKKLKKQLK